MIATSVGFDIVFLIHILSAVAVLIVLVTLRLAAKAVATGASAEKQKAAFPVRTNWAARLLHVMPITGLILVATGGSDNSLSKPWVGVGLACYILAAGHMEARTLPQERVLAKTISENGVASPAAGKKFALNVDVLLGLIAVAFLAMLIQF
jgi:hypothetical protein